MNSAQNNVLSKDVMVRQLLLPLEKFLKTKGVTEIAINAPNEVWTESNKGWEKHSINLEMAQITALAKCYCYLYQSTDLAKKTLYYLLNCLMESVFRLFYRQPLKMERYQ